MIVLKGDAPIHRGDVGHALGAFETRHRSDAGGLTQFGAYVETLRPGSRSSERHWHEEEDEFLYLLSGVATLIENDGEHELQPLGRERRHARQGRRDRAARRLNEPGQGSVDRRLSGPVN